MGLALPVLAVVVGVLIGMVGVGGVLLPPGLVALGDLTANEATATSTGAFVFTSVVGTVAYAWRGVVPWGMLARLTVGVVPAAFLGALVNATRPASVVLLGLGALTLFVGVQQLRPRAVRETRDGLGTAALVVVGAFVGFGSALTGTGGPVLLVPVLLTLGLGRCGRSRPARRCSCPWSPPARSATCRRAWSTYAWARRSAASLRSGSWPARWSPRASLPRGCGGSWHWRASQRVCSWWSARPCERAGVGPVRGPAGRRPPSRGTRSLARAHLL